jgi:uncharacterized glyoxalase superfamily protein PhnB
MADAHSPDVVPYLSYRNGGAALDFLTRAFGLQVVQRVDDGGSLVHAELRHGNGVVMIGTADLPKGSPGIYLVVHDAATHHATAIKAGANEVYPPEKTEWGTWRWRGTDIEGHEWTFGTYAPSTVAPDWS